MAITGTFYKEPSKMFRSRAADQSARYASTIKKSPDIHRITERATLCQSVIGCNPECNGCFATYAYLRYDASADNVGHRFSGTRWLTKANANNF